MTYLAMIKFHLNDIASQLIKKISSDHLGLTLRQIRVVRMVREGKKAEEIAKILNLPLTGLILC